MEDYLCWSLVYLKGPMGPIEDARQDTRPGMSDPALTPNWPRVNIIKLSFKTKDVYVAFCIYMIHDQNILMNYYFSQIVDCFFFKGLRKIIFMTCHQIIIQLGTGHYVSPGVGGGRVNMEKNPKTFRWSPPFENKQF